MIRRPPRSTLFPTRRSSDLSGRPIWAARDRHTPAGCARDPALQDGPRSEEHTSELQSRFDLVCRLLLEKKNNNAHDHLCIRTIEYLSRSSNNIDRIESLDYL